MVKTVVQYVTSPASDYGTTWAGLTKQDKKFFRKAAMKLCIKAKNLFKMGHPKVMAMLNERRNGKPPSLPTQNGLPKLNGCVVVGDLNSVEADMPPGEEIVLTREILNKCRANGAFTTETMKAFGLSYACLKPGWAQTLIGAKYAREVILKAMRGRHLYSPATFKARRKKERNRNA